MNQTTRQHNRLVRGNRKIKNMAIAKEDLELLDQKRIGRVFWSSIAAFYVVLGLIAYFSFNQFF